MINTTLSSLITKNIKSLALFKRYKRVWDHSLKKRPRRWFFTKPSVWKGSIAILEAMYKQNVEWVSLFPKQDGDKHPFPLYY